MTRRPGSEYGAICPDCRHLRSDHRSHSTTQQYPCRRMGCTCVMPRSGPWLPLWTKADYEAFMARTGLKPLDAGEFDGKWLLAIGVAAVVLLVLLAVTANPGSVH